MSSMVYGCGYSVCEPASVPFAVDKTLQQNLVSVTKIHHITSGFKVLTYIVASSMCSSCNLSTKLISDDWTNPALQSQSEKRGKEVA